MATAIILYFSTKHNKSAADLKKVNNSLQECG